MITAQVIGAEETLRRLRGMPAAIADELEKEIREQGYRLQLLVQQKLSGRVLNRRTGTLRSSINLRVNRGPDRIEASVGTGVRYAGVHEFGFNGDVQVREYTRSVSQVFGNDVSAIQTVRAHVRRMHMPERSFLRSSLADMADDIRRGIAGAVRRGTERIA